MNCGFIIFPQFGILQTLQDAPFRRFVQRGRERLVLLFQFFVFGGSLGEGYVVLSQLVLHPCHVGDIAVQHLADLRCTALAVEGVDAYQQGIQLLLLLGQLGHLLEDAGRNVLPSRLAGAFAPFQLRVLLDHVLPELVLPLHKVLAVADDLLGAQPPVRGQGHKAEVQVGQLVEDEYFGRTIYEELSAILKDIRTAQITDDTTSDGSAIERVRQSIESAKSFEGSAEEQQLRALCKQVGKDFDSLNKADVAATMRILRELPPTTTRQGRAVRKSMDKQLRWKTRWILRSHCPTDDVILLLSDSLHPGFVPVCRIPLQSERSRAIMPL